MSTIQCEGVLSYIDEDGNVTELYPDIKTDTSLSTSGKAADAKVVGDKVVKAKNTLDTKVSALETKLNSFGIIKSDIVNSPLGTALSMSSNTKWDNMLTLLTGVANKGAWNGSISTSGGSVTIPKGYHNGSGKVTGPTLANLIGTNVTLASSSKLLSGYTAYGKNGVKYTGTASSYSDGYNDGYSDGLADAPAYSYGSFKTPNYPNASGGTYTLELGYKPTLFIAAANSGVYSRGYIYCETAGINKYQGEVGTTSGVYSDGITPYSNGVYIHISKANFSTAPTIYYIAGYTI